MQCLACCADMDVKLKQKQNFRRSYTTSKSGGIPIYVDIFSCPHAGEKWHDQVIALQKLKRDTPSAKISDIASEEITEIIKTKKPTKETWSLVTVDENSSKPTKTHRNIDGF